ncbi:MAG: ATP-binding cassette domain-containing protein [Nitrospinae bacterium]|nr:ATP-binding cassette domain-containing protein [Nitrospinota bacterium]
MPGECFGFLGPNGAGKSSVIRMTQCVSPVTAGAITVDGLTVGVDDRRIKALVGVCPQEDSLDEDLTVIENLRVYGGYFGYSRREAQRRGEGLLEFFHLADRRGANVRALSGGMRRRLHIARALINEPRLLILDEPTTGLDPQARHVIWQRIRELKGRGVTALITTHYMEEAERLCDRVALMDQGRILLTGAPGELVRAHVSGEVIELIPGGDGAARAARAMAELGDTVEEAGDTFFIYTADPARAMRRLGDANPESLSRRRATLEDLFLRMTGRALREGS